MCLGMYICRFLQCELVAITERGNTVPVGILRLDVSMSTTYPVIIINRRNKRSLLSNMVCEKLTNLVLILIMSPIIGIANRSESLFYETETFRSRREGEGSKKYLIFPQGSNVQLVYCMTIGTYAKPSGFFTMGVTAGLAWELPHRNTLLHREPAEVYHRKSRRELYRKVELMLSTRGMDGKACVHKALCQAGKRNSSEVGKGTFIQEILHSIFTLPDHSSNEDPRAEYDIAHEVSPDDDCIQMYSTCPEIFKT